MPKLLKIEVEIEPCLARFRFYPEGKTKLLRDYKQGSHISVFYFTKISVIRGIEEKAEMEQKGVAEQFLQLSRYVADVNGN